MKKIGYIITLTSLLFASSGAWGQHAMTQVHSLNFGTFATADVDTPQTITITPDNETVHSAGIVMESEGQCGEYHFTGLPPNVNFHLGVAVANPPNDGGFVIDDVDPLVAGAQSMTVDQFEITNNGVMQSDADGEATVCIGATLTTSGDGAMYLSNTYSGQYAITVYY